jgi:hypothetical protein
MQIGAEINRGAKAFDGSSMKLEAALAILG